MTAWLHPGGPDERARKLAPVATEALTDALATTDPARLPQGPLTAVEPLEVGPFAERHRVNLADGSLIEVMVVSDGAGGWLASTVRSLGPE